MSIDYGSSFIVNTKSYSTVIRNVLLRGRELGFQYINVLEDVKKISCAEATDYILAQDLKPQNPSADIAIDYQGPFSGLGFRQIEEGILKVSLIESTIEWRKVYGSSSRGTPETPRYCKLLMDLCADFIPLKISIEQEGEFELPVSKPNNISFSFGDTATYEGKSLEPADQILKNIKLYGYKLFSDKDNSEYLDV